jgi:hypothetical protein
LASRASATRRRSHRLAPKSRQRPRSAQSLSAPLSTSPSCSKPLLAAASAWSMPLVRPLRSTAVPSAASPKLNSAHAVSTSFGTTFDALLRKPLGRLLAIDLGIHARRLRRRRGIKLRRAPRPGCASRWHRRTAWYAAQRGRDRVAQLVCASSAGKIADQGLQLVGRHF